MAQAALFASFTAFWTILGLHLQDLRIGQQGDHDRSNPPNRSRV
jgi:hypothetical protein